MQWNWIHWYLLRAVIFQTRKICLFERINLTICSKNFERVKAKNYVFQNVKAIFQRIPVSREAQVKVKQMLWNPVLPNMMAICLDDGTIGMYVLKDGYSSFEYFSIDKSEGAK